LIGYSGACSTRPANSGTQGCVAMAFCSCPGSPPYPRPQSVGAVPCTRHVPFIVFLPSDDGKPRPRLVLAECQVLQVGTFADQPSAGPCRLRLDALLPELQLMGLPFRSPGERVTHRMAKHEVGAGQQRLV